MEDAQSSLLCEFRELVAQHHAGLRAFVRFLGVSPDWVDDLAQETFLIAFRELKRFEPGGDFGKWLRGIARNVVRNELQKEVSRRRVLHEGLSQLLVRREPGAVPAVERASLSALRDCVEQLPKRCRELVAGRYGDGCTATELAEQMNLTPDATRKALSRIRLRLKDCVESRVASEA